MKSITMNSGSSLKSAIYYLQYCEPVPEIAPNFICGGEGGGGSKKLAEIKYNSINMDYYYYENFIGQSPNGKSANGTRGPMRENIRQQYKTTA